MGNTDLFELESLTLACNRLRSMREAAEEAYNEHLDPAKIAWARKFIDCIAADIEQANEPGWSLDLACRIDRPLMPGQGNRGSLLRLRCR